ncbi:hypothetical protein Lal_00012528 [Lupinus albus]|uniref:Uncharacterized protein n=1 Tax=Lupinus albus TaxID=3870 RepID=A0A6A5N8B3_LUPAL|nr:hypothetical protein Lalb_Chr22g0360291 [Lupinus albus]KAF1883614.1 hypothetical protein Lal_00012528 [Lupinus albus]
MIWEHNKRLIRWATQTFASLAGVEAGQHEVELVGKDKVEAEGGLEQSLVSELVTGSNYMVVQQVVDVVGEELPSDSEIVGPKEIEHVKMVETVSLSET